MNETTDLLKIQNDYFNTGITKNIGFRIKKLQILKKAIIHYEDEILDALKKDLNKSAFEAYATEIGIVLEEINYIIKHLPKWSKSKSVKTPMAHFLSSSKIHYEPYGIALIMSPWNYPFQLTIAPLIGSIAAGNCTVLKPSSYSPHTSDLIAKMIKKCFDEKYVAVILGGREVNQSILKEKFDFIFFTGSIPVGKIVMEAASKNLTPVVLELGGKSPCIVDETANLKLAARRIIWGKLLNSGQTCIAPDYILVKREVKEKLIQYMKKAIIGFYGLEPHLNPEYPKIINQHHYERLLNLMNNGTIVTGGVLNPETNQIAPTILDHVTWKSEIMEEEIFGPLLPVIVYDDLDEVVQNIRKKPKPLALYFFSNNKQNQKLILNNLSFGGGCINDTIIHVANGRLPFGGVGDSGMGSYHGKSSFNTFSHAKSILTKTNLFDISFRYPPYNNRLALLKKLMK